MEIPRSCTEVVVCFPCPICNGNGGFGMRQPDNGSGGRTPISANFKPCDTCNGTGWKPKRPAELTQVELTRLLAKLPKAPAQSA